MPFCLFVPLSLLQSYLRQKYSVNNIKLGERGGKKIPDETLIKCLLSGCRLWIRVLICQLPHFFHPSHHPFPSFPDVITLHHTVISLFLPALTSFLISPPRHSSWAIFTCQNDHLSRVCVCVCVCACVCALVLLCLERYLSGRWSEEKIVCIINDSLETGKRQIVKVNECVCICLCALSCLSAGIPASLWARRWACLSIFFHLSVFLSGQFAVWGPPQWWRAVGRRPR